jgi:hypothetical protein
MSDILPKEIQEMIGHLRRGLLYFMREGPDRVAGIAETAKQATEELQQYNEMAEEFTDRYLCKYNLHVLNCRLPAQEAQRGSVPQCSEFFIERAVQECKSDVRYRTTSNPETTLAKGRLVEFAMTQIRVKYPFVKDVEGHFPDTPELRNRMLEASGLKVTDEQDSMFYLGIGFGKPLTEDDPKTSTQYGTAVRALLKMMGDVPERLVEDGWDLSQRDAQTKQATYVRYLGMDLFTSEIVQCQEYRRNKTRMSYHVLCVYDLGTEIVHFVARIKFFVVATLSEGVTVKYGVADLWRLKHVKNVMGEYWVSEDFDKDPVDPNLKDLGVHVRDMDRKLLMDHPTALEQVIGARTGVMKPVRQKYGRRWYEYGGKSKAHRYRQ